MLDNEIPLPKLIYFLAITELPCKTDGFAGNYDYDQTTPCNDEGMVFCYQNCSDLLWEKKGSQTIYSEQFLVTECFFNLFLEVSHI